LIFNSWPRQKIEPLTKQIPVFGFFQHLVSKHGLVLDHLLPEAWKGQEEATGKRSKSDVRSFRCANQKEAKYQLDVLEASWGLRKGYQKLEEQ